MFCNYDEVEKDNNISHRYVNVVVNKYQIFYS